MAKAKIIRSSKKTKDSDADGEKAEMKMKRVQSAKLNDTDEDDEAEREKNTERENEQGKKTLKKLKIKSYSAMQKEDREDDDDVLAQSRPKTSGDQFRVLKRDANPDHTALVQSAREKMALNEKGGDEELSEEEVDAYLLEEKDHLLHYGKVKLTPARIATKKQAIQASSGITDEDDAVKVTMFTTIDPAPHVGQVNVVRDFGYEKLEKGETYLLPKVVALVLAEGKKGAIHD